LYIPVLFGELKIAALVDNGSSINVLSKSMYDSVSDRHKLRFERLGDSEIRLANDDKIRIHGIAKLQAIIHSQHEGMPVPGLYLFPCANISSLMHGGAIWPCWPHS
jgi:hypothetical protein